MINKLKKFMLDEYSYQMYEYKIFKAKKTHYIPVVILVSLFICTFIFYVLGDKGTIEDNFMSIYMIISASIIFFLFSMYVLNMLLSEIFIITPKYIIKRNKCWRFNIIDIDDIVKIDFKTSVMYRGLNIHIISEVQTIKVDVVMYAGDLSFLVDIFEAKGLIENINNEIVKKDITIKIVNDSVEVVDKL